MPPKRRTRRTVNYPEESDDTDHNMPVVIIRKSTRKKHVVDQKKTFKRHRGKSFDNDYDADSEEDEKFRKDKQVKSDKQKQTIHIDTDSSEEYNHVYSKVMMDCSVILTKRTLSPKLISTSSMDNNYSSLSRNGTEESSDEMNRSKDKVNKEFANKENVTPPDSHSTPALLKLASRKLDDSLFGFNCLDAPLQFSPVSNENKLHAAEILGQSTMSLIVSPHKRKLGKGDAGFYDLPIELPKKRQRKKNITKKNKDVVEKDLENLRSQFAEVEMHELAIE